jgi:glycosyltransferase involved in cell wall biosynthesis
MMTNTFTPHTGGVARSVESFTGEYRRLGHCVTVMAPIFEGMPENEQDVIRIPAIQKFNGSDFSVRLPIPSFLFPSLDRFKPDIVHAHHPFLLGDTAICVAASRMVPLVFTHHTIYEQYTHYVPGDSPMLKRFVIELSTGFANLCDAVVAPSESVAEMLRTRGVTTPVSVIPTGVNLERFAYGEGFKLRAKLKIPRDAFVVGHIGRLAPEKNLDFLGHAVAGFLKEHPRTHFLIGGTGPSQPDIEKIFKETSLDERLHFAGNLSLEVLPHAYHAMDVFAFASQTETQGMVLTEAMASGLPVVAIDGPGVREVVKDKRNGRLLETNDPAEFTTALSWIFSVSEKQRKALREGALKTASKFSLERTASKMLKLYRVVSRSGRREQKSEGSLWQSALQMIEAEWEIWVNRTNAARAALAEPTSPTEQA